jgi:hypothetical protein
MNKKEEVRTKNLVIRVTESEKKIIENNSKNLGLEVSNYGRQLMINGIVFSVIKQENTIKENFDRRTLIGLANNLNQLTRYTHQTNRIPKLEELLDKIEKIIER